jgi:LEA14-like dessication related protein
MILFIRLRFILLLLLLCIAGIALYYYKNQKEALKFILPKIKKVTLVKAKIHHDTAHIELYVLAQNQSPYTLNIKSIAYDAYLGKVKLITEEQHLGLVQRSNEEDTVDLVLKIPTKHTMSTIDSLQQSDSTDIKFDFKVIYNTFFGEKQIDLSRTYNIEVPIPPRIRIIETDRKKFRLFKKNADVDLYLEITNEGKFIELEIEDLHYELILGNNELYTHGKFGKKIKIDPGSKVSLKFPLHFDIKKPGSTLVKIWTNEDRIPFHLTLKGYLNGRKFNHLPVEIIGSGKTELVK